MIGMNERVRQVVKAVMQERELTQTRLAEELGMQQPNLTRLLSGRIGSVPENWQRVLDALDLELTATPKVR
jgi:transcriptional regulator with XRE-family HTH domain